MGLTSALNTSLNGLQLNETAIDVLGNNIANAGTTGFKASKVLFSTQLARTLSYGSRPTGATGGTNPRQIGLGATTAAISLDFSQGSVSATTSPSDLAIQGEGFFVLDSKEGPIYTRNGNFRLDSQNRLSNTQGNHILGYGVDANYNLVTTALTPLVIPLGNLHLAQQTQNIVLGGALSPQGSVSTRGTLQVSDVMTDAGNADAPVTAATLLTDVEQGGTALFPLGETVTFAASKGGRTMESRTLGPITNTMTLQDLMTFMDESIGIQDYTMPTAEPDGIPPGIDISGGQLRVKGNRGTINDIELPVGALIVSNMPVPLTFSATGPRADGESTVTTFTMYDSLGTPITVRMSAVMESQGTNSTLYRYFLETPNQSGSDIVIGNGTIEFDSLGKVVSTPNNQFSIDRSGTAAVSPMLFEANLSNISGISSTGSTLNLTLQDGTNPGTLTSYVIDEQGTINGAFDNGIIRTLGQIVLARFTNPSGLLQNGFDTYKEGISSGLPSLSVPGTFGSGTIRAGSIELSNTDIGRNLVDLIVASTNYRGNARVISSVDQLVNELLVLGRG